MRDELQSQQTPKIPIHVLDLLTPVFPFSPFHNTSTQSISHSKNTFRILSWLLSLLFFRRIHSWMESVWVSPEVLNWMSQEEHHEDTQVHHHFHSSRVFLFFATLLVAPIILSPLLVYFRSSPSSTNTTLSHYSIILTFFNLSSLLLPFLSSVASQIATHPFFASFATALLSVYHIKSDI